MKDLIQHPIALDVTIRDGGYLNDWHFELDDLVNIVSTISKSGIDFIEVGWLRSDTSLPLAKQCSVPYLQLLREKIRPETKIAVMVMAGDDRTPEMLEKAAPYVDLFRVVCSEQNFDEELAIASNIKKLGIPCSMNFAWITCYSNDEIRAKLDRVLAKDCADLIYIADSRGALTPDRTYEICQLLKGACDKSIGFHGHDNLGLAIENTQAALDAGATYVDASINGYGNGAGNTRLSDLIQLLQPMRPDIQNNIPKDLLELKRNPEPPQLYRYGGLKNLNQYWVQLIWEKYGKDSLDYLQKLPDNQLNKTMADVGL